MGAKCPRAHWRPPQRTPPRSARRLGLTPPVLPDLRAQHVPALGRSCCHALPSSPPLSQSPLLSRTGPHGHWRHLRGSLGSVSWLRIAGLPGLNALFIHPSRINSHPREPLRGSVTAADQSLGPGGAARLSVRPAWHTRRFGPETSGAGTPALLPPRDGRAGRRGGLRPRALPRWDPPSVRGGLGGCAGHSRRPPAGPALRGALLVRGWSRPCTPTGPALLSVSRPQRPGGKGPAAAGQVCLGGTAQPQRAGPAGT